MPTNQDPFLCEQTASRLVHVKIDLAKDLFLRIAYEHLLNFCYLCGLLNHIEKSSGLKYEVDMEFLELWPFSPRLRVEDKGSLVWTEIPFPISGEFLFNWAGNQEGQ